MLKLPEKTLAMDSDNPESAPMDLHTTATEKDLGRGLG